MRLAENTLHVWLDSSRLERRESVRIEESIYAYFADVISSPTCPRFHLILPPSPLLAGLPSHLSVPTAKPSIRLAIPGQEHDQEDG